MAPKQNTVDSDGAHRWGRSACCRLWHFKKVHGAVLARHNNSGHPRDLPNAHAVQHVPQALKHHQK